MTRRRIIRTIFIALLSMCIVVGVIIVVQTTRVPSAASVEAHRVESWMIEPERVRRDLQALPDADGTGQSLIGVIVPHHSAASSLIVDAILRLRDHRPDRIIVLAPDHRERGHAAVSTGLLPWETSEGTVRIDQHAAQTLAKVNGIVIDEDALEGEHGIGTALPYIAAELEGTSIVPLSVRVTATAEERDHIAQAIASLSGRTCIVLSVDFTHYQSRDVTERNGSASANAIARLNATFFEHLGSTYNDYVDSPNAVMIALSAWKEMGADSADIVRVASTADLALGAEHITGYIEAVVPAPL